MHAPPRPASPILLACLVAALAGCGGGGEGAAIVSGSPDLTLTVTTTFLPGGSPDTPYATTQLQATGAQGPTSWSLAGGALPQGLDLDGTGRLSGTPRIGGTFPFVVRVEDDVAADTQPLTIVIGTLDVAITGGLVAGDAWTGRAVTLGTVGRTGSITFSIVTNESGGAFATQDAGAGTAVWTPGPSGGAGVVDTLRATDAGNAGTAEVDVPVMPSPVDGHEAAFGTTDVWYVDASPKMGAHAYATDFHKALADTGLRDPASTGATGSTADTLAALWIRAETLRQVNALFLRERDGTAGGSGLAITFPFDEPGPGYSKAAPGSSLSGSPTRYSVMALVAGSSSGVIGTAFLDGARNGAHENDTTSGSLELGVFTNQITPVFNSNYANTLDDVPVGAADIPALKALLYETASPGGRYALIRYTGRGLARSLAAVIAHEVGHSLGLDHTDPPQGGSIMNPSASISPTASYSFTSEDVSRLQTALPGAGRATGGQTLQKGVLAPGGVRVCNCRAHGRAGR